MSNWLYYWIKENEMHLVYFVFLISAIILVTGVFVSAFHLLVGAIIVAVGLVIWLLFVVLLGVTYYKIRRDRIR